MNILHVSAECYPVAKVGGMGDVVGSLPRYQCEEGTRAAVAMPKYDNEWIRNNQFDTLYEGKAPLEGQYFNFKIQLERNEQLGFPLYVIDIPGRFDRPNVYLDPATDEGYEDEFQRFLSFQIALLDWIANRDREFPDIVHCHDHHTGLIPFMMSHVYRYGDLQNVPSVFTIHNAEYQGIHPLEYQKMIPNYDLSKRGLLDWDGNLNTLAAGIKSGWRVTTVSETYMQELRQDCRGLEILIDQEWEKCTGILNGIDIEVWNPSTDPMIAYNFSPENRTRGKRHNKQELADSFDLNPDLPVVSFIGRLVREKGADLLPDLINRLFARKLEVNFMILGKGNKQIHRRLEQLSGEHVGYFDARLEYNEQLAHQIYAGSDFICMPSRTEPCGLNQMYAMRYGTMPVVRAVGGLEDSVVDFEEPKGYGFKFDQFSIESALEAIERGLDLYSKKRKRSRIIGYMMRLDFSWNASAREYINLYRGLY